MPSFQIITSSIGRSSQENGFAGSSCQKLCLEIENATMIIQRRTAKSISNSENRQEKFSLSAKLQ